MTQTIFATYHHLALLADYHTPDMHAHLCSHFALAKSGALQCVTEQGAFESTGAFIGSNALHTIACEGPMLLYFFDETSVLGAQIRTRYLPAVSAAAAPLEVSSAARACLEHFLAEPNPQAFDQQILGILLGDEADAKPKGLATADPRIAEALLFLQEQDEVSHDVIDQLAKHVCLSKSRLSHLFTQEMGVSLHRYLAFVKMRKAAEYIAQGSSLTDAAIRAGFDSPSHLSSTVKRMFGISMTDVMRSM